MPAPKRANLKELLVLGARARKDGDHAAALNYFETAVAANPHHVRARFLAGCELREAARDAEAEAMFRSLLDDDPAHAEALINIGEMLTDQSRLAEADDSLQRALQTEPENVRALLGLARLERARDRRVEALALLHRAANANPGHPGTQLAIAIELRDQGELDQARQRLEAVIASNPRHQGAWMHLGRIERLKGAREAALAAFNKVAEFHPQFVNAYIEIAVEQRALGHPKQCEATLARALKLDPRNQGVLLQMAENAWISGDDSKALERCRAVIAAHPKAVQAYLNASRSAAGLGDGDEAFALLEQAEEAIGPDPAIAAKRMELFRLAGEWDDARAELQALAPEISRHFRVWHQHVLLEIEAGDYNAAAVLLNDPPAIGNQERARVHELRGKLAEARWRFDEAIEEFRKSIELNPSDATVHLELARVHLLKFDLTLTKDNLKKSVGLNLSRKLLRGESLNISQSYLGQILNEFELDRGVVQAITGANALAGEARVGALSALMRAEPDSTPAAIAVLLARRQTGLLPIPGGSSATQTELIPQRITQYWDNPVPPRSIVDIMHSWRQQNPDWAYERFDDKAAAEFIRARLSIETLRAYLRAPHPAQKADLFRLCYLALEGGFYIDADDRCLAPLDTIAPRDVDLVLYQEDYGTIGNNFIGARPHHPVIERALALATESINRGDKDTYWLSTGPGLMARVVAQLLSEAAARDELGRIVVLERGELARAVAIHCELSYKKTGKHWVRSAFRSGNKAARS